MKKKLILFLICILLVGSTVLGVSAKAPLVNDYANLFTSTQRQDLTQRSEELKRIYGLDVVILTAPDIFGKSAQSFADDFYDNNGYGADGILFLLDMGGRQWHISTAGTAISALSDRDLQYIEERVVPDLSEGRYYEAFLRFYDVLPGRLASEEDSGFSLGLSVLAGAVIALIAILIMRSGMNTRKPQRSAVNYQDDGSFRLGIHQDLFLYSNVSKRPRPQNNGGSSTHRGSSGASHGGRGGRF